MAKEGPDPNVPKRPTKGGGKGVVREYLEAIGIALAVALMLRFFVIEAFKIPSGSMIETLNIGDFIFVNKLSYRAEIPYSLLWWRFPAGGTTLAEWDEPEAGDIAVFRWPRDQTTDYIKRLVATAGQTVELRRNELYIDGEKLARSFEKSITYHDQRCNEIKGRMYTERIGDKEYSVILGRGGGAYQNFGPIKVKPNHLFAMGDNRDNSSDSREWGQVPVHYVKGRALFVWLSIDPCASLAGRVRLSRIGTPVR